MAQSSPIEAKERATEGFDVMCVVGFVTYGNGDVTATEAAFALIGRHGASGSYSFPSPDGGTVFVDVAYSDRL
jgi:hypothetical protein